MSKPSIGSVIFDILEKYVNFQLLYTKIVASV